MTTDSLPNVRPAGNFESGVSESSSRSARTGDDAPSAARAALRSWKVWVGAAVIGAVVAAWFLLPVDQGVDSARGWFEKRGAAGGLLFVGAYAVGTLLLVPGAIMTIAAGMTYGVGWGWLIVMCGAVVGSTLSFIIARHLARSAVERRLKKYPQSEAVDRAIAEEGWKAVFLLRLSPVVPFNFQNYFFGVTRVSFVEYVAASTAGMAPGAFLYAYLGSVSGKALGGDAKTTPAEWAMWAVGFVATAAVVILLTRKSKQKLEALGVEEASSAARDS